MKFNFFLLSCLLLLSVSCGHKDDDNDSTVVVNTPTEEEGDDSTNRTIRYSGVEQQYICGMGFSCKFSLTSNLNRRPVTLNADFMDNGELIEETGGTPSDPATLGSCQFTVTLNEEQADHLEALADNLRYCKNTSGITMDGVSILMNLIKTNGDKIMADAFKREDMVEDNYICAGGSAYNSYVKSLMSGKVPASCPDHYGRIFTRSP